MVRAPETDLEEVEVDLGVADEWELLNPAHGLKNTGITWCQNPDFATIGDLTQIKAGEFFMAPKNTHRPLLRPG